MKSNVLDHLADYVHVALKKAFSELTRETLTRIFTPSQCSPMTRFSFYTRPPTPKRP